MQHQGSNLWETGAQNGIVLGGGWDGQKGSVGGREETGFNLN